MDVRILQEHDRSAEEALLQYAVTLRAWNDPDDEHTRRQLRAMVEMVIVEAVPYK